MKVIGFCRVASSSWLIILLIISGVGLGALFSYVWETTTIPFEVKEPLELLGYTSELSLFPGEQQEIFAIVRNNSPINYSVQLSFQVNGTDNYNRYINFSDETYQVIPGENNLTGWISVASCAPPINASLTIEFKRVSALPINGDTGFEDDFESHTVGTFPDTWDLIFNGAGNAYQIIVDDAFVSPTKSLQLKGTYSWSADAVKHICTDASTISFEAYVKIDEVLGTSGHSSRVGFWSLKPNGWARWYSPVVFLDDGTIRCGGQVLQSHEPGLWYKVNQIFDRDANVLSVRINDVLKGTDISGPTTFSPYDIQAFALSGRYTGMTTFYDDVKFSIEP